MSNNAYLQESGDILLQESGDQLLQEIPPGGGTISALGTYRLWQYQGLAAPLYYMAPESLLPDRLVANYQPPVRRIPTLALCMAAVVAPLFVPDVTTPAPAMSWRSGTAYPDRIYRTTLPKAAHLVSAQNIDPITNPISPQGGGTIAALGTYTLWQYQAIAGPLAVPSVAEVELQWQPVYPDAIRQPKRLTTASQRPFAFDRFQAPDVAPDIPDQGPFVRNAQTIRIPSQVARMQAFAMDAQWTAPPQLVQTLGWRPRYPDTAPAPLFRRAVYTWAQPHFGVTIQVPVMSWTGLYLDPPIRPISRRALMASGMVSPIALADITTQIPEMSWLGYEPDFVFGPRRSIAALTARWTGPLFVPGITVVPPDYIGVTYPAFIQPPRNLRVGSQLYEVVDPQWTAPAVVAAPALAKPVYPDYIWRKAPVTIHPDWVGEAYVLDVTVPAPLLSWLPNVPDHQLRPIHTVLTPGGWLVTEPLLVTFAGTVRITWYNQGGTRRKGPTSRW